MTLKTIVAALAVSGIVCGTASAAFAGDGKPAKDGLEGKANLGKAEAKKIALARVPKGKVKEAELEKEDGRLVWSLDLSTPGTKDITEVLVDAKTGTIVSVEKDTPDSELKERKAKHKEKGGKNKGGQDEDRD